MWTMYCGIARDKSNHEVPTVIDNFPFQEAQDYKMCKTLSLSLYRNIYLTDIQLFLHQIAFMEFFSIKIGGQKMGRAVLT